MAEFKPMTKMETTEPSVVLKLKNGGHVAMKKGGMAEGGFKSMGKGASIPSGALQALMENPALVGRPAVNAIVRNPGKPSMAARRAAMMAPRRPPVAVRGAGNLPAGSMPMMAAGPDSIAGAMKKGGKAEGGKSDMAQDKAMLKKAFKQHDAQEHMGGKGTKLALKKGGKMATGGVVNGMKSGGSAMAGAPKGGVRENEKVRTDATTRTTTANQTGYSAYKNGGIMSLKEKGGIQENDKVIMSGTSRVHEAIKNPGYETYKKGGSAKKAYATGGRVESGAPVAMPQGTKPVPKPIRINQLTGTYKKGGCVKMKDGGDLPPPKDMSKGAYDRFYADEKAENEDMSNAILGFPGRMVDKVKSLFSTSKPAGSVTKTEKSVTVSPGKKRGGKA